MCLKQALLKRRYIATWKDHLATIARHEFPWFNSTYETRIRGDLAHNFDLSQN